MNIVEQEDCAFATPRMKLTNAVEQAVGMTTYWSGPVNPKVHILEGVILLML